MKMFHYYRVFVSGRTDPYVYRAQTKSQAKRLAELDGYLVMKVEE